MTTPTDNLAHYHSLVEMFYMATHSQCYTQGGVVSQASPSYEKIENVSSEGLACETKGGVVVVHGLANGPHPRIYWLTQEMHNLYGSHIIYFSSLARQEYSSQLYIFILLLECSYCR